MAKKVKFESFKYRFLVGLEGCRESVLVDDHNWLAFVSGLSFEQDASQVLVRSEQDSQRLSVSANLKSFKYHIRKGEHTTPDDSDTIRTANDQAINLLIEELIREMGFPLKESNRKGSSKERLEKERVFHDEWAESEDLHAIDIKTANEVCTAPEMRYITKRLGDLRDKRLLDVGCGLGEASVYFAMLGANVTSSDLSPGMLNAAAGLAKINGVEVQKHLASAEDMALKEDQKFDVIYSGNLLHHVEIEETLKKVKPHLDDKGVLVTWDPLAYNPVINLYRLIATDVRTPDEHPLKWSDLKLFEKHFEEVERKYFWFFTLIIFVFMALVQRRNPNKERFWKVVLHEGDKWAWLYKPLEKLDRFILAVFPPLRLLCWNVVIIASRPKVSEY